MSSSRPSSRTERSHSSTKPDSRPHSTSPKKSGTAVRNGEPRTKTGSTSNGSTSASNKVATEGKTIADMAKKTSPGTTRKISSPSGIKPVAKSVGSKASDGGGSNNDKSSRRSSVADSSRQKNTRSPTGEESKRKQSTVLDKKSSPLTQRKVATSQVASKKGRSSPEDRKLKSPTHNTSPGTTRRGTGETTRVPRTSVTQTDRSGTKTNNKPGTRKQVTSGKPPSGAHSSTTGTTKSTSSAKQSNTTNVGKAGGISNGASGTEGVAADGKTKRVSSPTEKQEKVRKVSPSTGSSVGGGKKTATSTLRKSAAINGRESPAGKDRKSSVEKRPRSSASSPSTLRRTGSVRKPPGSGSTSPGVVRRSSTLRRISSSGSIPVTQKTNTEKKAGSVSPKVERRVSAEKKTTSPSPKNEREKKTSNPGSKLSSTSSETTRISSAESVRKSSTDKNPCKQSTGLNPTGRRSVRSRSEVNMLAPKRNESQSLGRKVSAASSIGRGSPSPNTLAGKSIILDCRDLQGEDRLQSTLKLFGARGAAPKGGGIKKASKGPVIKTMGVRSSTGGRGTPISGRGTPSGRVSSPHITPAIKSQLTRTGSGSIARKASPSPNLTSRDRLHSSDDILKAGRLSPTKAGHRSPAGTGRLSPTKAGRHSTAETGRLSPTKAGRRSSAETGRHSPAETGRLSPTKDGHRSSAETGRHSSAETGHHSPAGNGRHSPTKAGCHSPAGTGRHSPTKAGHHSPAGTGRLSPTKAGRHSPAGTGHHSPAGTGHHSPAGTGHHSPAGTGHRSPAETGRRSPARTGRHSPAETGHHSPAGAVRAPSPLSKSSNTQPEKKKTEKSVPQTVKANDDIKKKNPALARIEDSKGNLVSRPSCRNTQVKSKIATWTKMEEEAKKLESPSMSPIPPSPRSPSTTSPHISSSPTKYPPLSSSHSSPHISPSTSPKIPLSSSPPHRLSHPSCTHPTPSSPTSSSRVSVSPPKLTSESQQQQRRQRSQSPVVISSNSAPVKSRIAMWAEKEKESREARVSLSPQRSPQRSPQHSPKSSPQGSPNSSPRTLRRQSPIDRRRVSPAQSAASGSREGSIESTNASPSRQVPSITVKDENVNDNQTMSNKKSTNEIEVYDDVMSSPKKAFVSKDGKTSDVSAEEMYEDVEVSPKKYRPLPDLPVSEHSISVQEPTTKTSAPLIQEQIYSTIPDVFQNSPRSSVLFNEEREAPALPPRPDSIKNKLHSVQGEEIHVSDIEDDIHEEPNPSSSSYTRLKPTYTEIPILDDETIPASSVHNSLVAAVPLTPKSKRKWLRSPRFGHRKSSGDGKEQLEGAGSDREEKKHEGFIKRLGKIGSRSNKEQQAVKRRSGEPSPDATSKTSYDSDSGASSSPEGSQNALTVTNTRESRTRSSSEISKTDHLQPEIIPRSNSYSPAASPEVGYALTSRKNLDPATQRVVVSDPALAEHSTQYDVIRLHGKLDPVTQRVVSDPSLEQSPSSSDAGSEEKLLLAKPNTVQNYRKSAPPSQRWNDRVSPNPLSHDIRSLIDNMGDGLEFCEKYTRKISTLSERSEPIITVGSAPSGLRLPVRFDLNSGSDTPNHVKVGFDLPLEDSSNKPEASIFLPNGMEDRGRRGTSDSSSASEIEEHERDDSIGPIESSLDRGRHTRYDIKRKLSESSDNSHLVKNRNQNSENLVVTSLMYADAVWDRVGNENDELSFSVGDVIEILDMSDDTWWQGNVREKSGWFPSAFVRLRIAQDEEDDDIYAVPPDAIQLGGGGDSSSTIPRVTTMPGSDPTYATYTRSSKGNRRMTIRRKDSCPSMPRKLTPSEVRAKVVEEILNTERDYVKHLDDIIEGFLKKCRLNTKLFDRERVETIFSNLENLYKFQIDFLRQLESRVNEVNMEESQIGEVFVTSRDGFAVYSEYCNNHPHAVNEMSSLQKKEQYAFFFESCRLLRNLQNIPLEGFLLLPVQKICKYPLQLSELLKYTSEDHPDRSHVEAAVDTMRQVAMHINEGKRRLENIGRIGKWQESIDGWKGPDIVETSTEMIHSSELHKISKGHSQERHFFLFDNQLIYCKKDAIGGRLSYKGRLAMETCHVTDLPDGQETHSGVPVKNAWKMDNQAKGKDYIIFAKSSEVKSKWMDAFQREKDRVAQDKESGFNVSLKMKRAAAALTSATARVSVAKRNRSFNKKQVLKVQGLSVSVESNVKIDGSPARERKGKFSRMKQIF